jgi:hypothetical protein
MTMHSSMTRYLVIAGMFALVGCSKPGATTDTSTSTAPASGGSAASTSGPASSGTTMPDATPPPAPPSNPIEVKAGTPLVVTVDQSVNSKTNNPGDRFDASLAAPVTIGGQQVIPSGTRVVGVVTDAKSAGKFKGHAEITVTLDSINVNGTRYPMRTTSVTEAGKGRGKRTGIGAGGGAVVGGIIGAIAGGDKGAAIGAGAGAGAGAAGAGFTGDRDIEISAETRLHFRLKDPLEINGK